MANTSNADPELHKAWLETFNKYGFNGLFSAFERLPITEWKNSDKKTNQALAFVEIMIFQAIETAIFAKDHSYINETQFEAYCKQLFEISELKFEALFKERLEYYCKSFHKARIELLSLYLSSVLPKTDYAVYFCSKFAACIQIAAFKNAAFRFGDKLRTAEYSQLERKADEIFQESIYRCQSGGGQLYFVSIGKSLYSATNHDGEKFYYLFNTRDEAEEIASELRKSQANDPQQMPEIVAVDFRKALIVLPKMRTQGVTRLILHQQNDSGPKVLTIESILISLRQCVAETDELEFARHASAAYGIPEQAHKNVNPSPTAAKAQVTPTPTVSGNDQPAQVSCGVCKRILEPEHSALACPRCGSNEKAYNDPHAVLPASAIFRKVIFWIFIAICALGFIVKLLNESARHR